MKTKNILTKNILILALLLAFVVFVSGCTNSTAPNTTPAANTANPTSTTDNSATANPPTTTENPPSLKITDARFANSAYLISGDTLDAAAQNAISGFSIDKTVNADGTTTIKLSSSNPDYTNQSYTLQSGQKLYFIETNLGDDGNNNEFNVGDDRALITDADGNIQMPNAGQANQAGPRRFGNMTDAQRLQFAQQMIDACNGKQESDSCVISSPRGDLNGTCQTRNSTLTCTMQRPSGSGRYPGQ